MWINLPLPTRPSCAFADHLKAAMDATPSIGWVATDFGTKNVWRWQKFSFVNSCNQSLDLWESSMLACLTWPSWKPGGFGTPFFHGVWTRTSFSKQSRQFFSLVDTAPTYQKLGIMPSSSSHSLFGNRKQSMV